MEKWKTSSTFLLKKMPYLELYVQLCANSAWKFVGFFMDISCKLSPYESICIKCQALISEKKQGNNFILSAETFILAPVVQSVVSLTSSLRVISSTVLADTLHNIPIFFAEKMWVAFAQQSYSHFFSKKFQHICISLDVNFNESLTNDIVSFEQLGPVC